MLAECHKRIVRCTYPGLGHPLPCGSPAVEHRPCGKEMKVSLPGDSVQPHQRGGARAIVRSLMQETAPI